MRVAKKYATKFKEVWVVTGPVFIDPAEKLESGVEIPDASYKIIVDEDGDEIRMLAVIMDQGVSGRESLSSFLVTVDEVERLTGIDFFAKLPDDVEDASERQKPKKIW